MMKNIGFDFLTIAGLLWLVYLSKLEAEWILRIVSLIAY
jgi:hypothetical protein